MSKPADPHLARLHTLAQEALAGYEALLEQYTPEQLAWKPSAEAWSMAGCAEHVLKTDRLYDNKLAAATKSARADGKLADRDFRPRWLLRTLFYPFIRPDSSRKTKTFAVVEPGTSGDPEAAVAAIQAFAAHQRQTYLPLVSQADGLDLRRVRVVSPFTKLIKFQLGEALEIIALHQKRHLQQAQRVADAPGFPSA
jgi:hypothetical protein